MAGDASFGSDGCLTVTFTLFCISLVLCLIDVPCDDDFIDVKSVLEVLKYIITNRKVVRDQFE